MPTPEDLKVLFPNEHTVDLFAYYKAQALHIIALITLLAVAWYKYTSKEGFEKNLFTISLALFTVIIILSNLFSQTPSLAWHGMIDRFEGTKTWLSYVILAYGTYTFLKSKEDGVKLITAFVLSSTVVSLIGAFQNFGYDFFTTDLGKRLMLGSYYTQLVDQVNFTFAEGRVYSTLYNPNYVGSLIALSFPMTVYLIWIKKHLVWKGLFAISMILQLISLIGSRSSGGAIALLVTLTAMVIWIIANLKFSKQTYTAIAAFVLLIGVIASQTSFIQDQYGKVKRSFEGETINEFKALEYDHPSLKFILEDDSWFTITPEYYAISVETMDGIEVRTDASGDNVNYRFTYDNYSVRIIHNRALGRIEPRISNLETEHLSIISLDFIMENQFSIMNMPLNSENTLIESSSLINNESFFSNRGYIWNRSIPLILNRPFLGHGADTFTLVFPQVDVLNRFMSFWNHQMIVDKPHNIYIQLAMNFGLLGLILFLAMSVYAVWKSHFHFLSLSVLGYLTVGLVNDSIVAINFMYFILIGILMTLSKMNNQEGLYEKKN